jgi:hypothetical protein
MMGRRLGVALTTAILSLANHASAQTPEERAVARDLIAKHGDAVVFVLGTTKIRINQGGKEVPNPDQRLQSLVTLLDSTGLGVMSLTALDPSDLASAQLSRGRAAGAAISVTMEASELRYRLADGREVPVRVVLRDKELDLAFLRPIAKPSAPMPAIDTAVAKASAVDLVIDLERLPEVAGWQAAARFLSVQAVLEKPRTVYLPNGGVAGSPVFDTRGRFVGVVLRLKNESDAANAPFIVLPASDIREVAKQAN